ncbi:MAG: PIG-L deacetylase family protein [Planctomycetota bacterium]
MNSIGSPDIRTVLCLGAHADDIEIGCGGTILKMLLSNPEIKFHWVVFSADGHRRQEALESVRSLTESDRVEIETHSYTDAYFPSQWKNLKREFSRLRRRVKPDLIFTHRREDRHQDHSTISNLTWNAFRNHLIFEYEIPKYEGDLGQPNVFVPLDEELMQLKCRWVIDAFKTQADKHWFDEETMKSILRLRGIESGRNGRYAEAFYCRKLSISF